MTELVLESVSKRFGSVAALDSVSLDIPHGRLVCLLGPSGCGKTTLLRAIAGLEEIDSGRVLIAGADQAGVPTHQRNLGMVFQSLALFPHLSVGENVAYPLAVRGAARALRRKRVAELLALVRLPGLEDRRIDQLSGGQRQRVAIARGLAIEPRVFLLDEPLSALDANLREHMQIELRQIQQRLGVTTVVVTHDQKEALSMADLVVVMKDGQAHQAGPPMEVYRNPVDSFVAGFIGQSTIMPCRRVGAEVFEIAGMTLRAAPARSDIAEGAQGLLALRPEDVALQAPEPGALSGEVAFIRELGESTQILLRVAQPTPAWNGEIAVALGAGAAPALAPGEWLGIAARPGRAVALAS